MHIAFHYPGLNLGGQQTQTLRLMQELNAMGHRVSWIYHAPGPLLEEARTHGTAHRIRMLPFNAGRFGIQRITNRAIYRVTGTWQLLRYCRRERVDALITANTPDSILGARVAARSSTRHFRTLGGSLKQVEPHWLARYATLGVDERTSGYFGWPAVLEELAEVGVSSRKFVVLPMAVDTRRHFPLSEEERRGVRASLGIPGDALVIGWVGRVADNMQVWDTVELGRRLRARGLSDFRLLFVGGGDALDRLRAELDSSGLAPQSVVTGWVPYDRVNALVNAMDIVPLLEPDPHGGSIVREAIAAGSVALSVDGPSRVQREFMRPQHAVLVPSAGYMEHAAEAVARLSADPAQRRGLGEAAVAYARREMSFRGQAEALVAGIERLW